MENNENQNEQFDPQELMKKILEHSIAITEIYTKSKVEIEKLMEDINKYKLFDGLENYFKKLKGDK